jgi:pyruvate formate lyase activating enzyme
MYGYLHSWELVTAVDGPGTRLVFFMQGCAFRCIYCQNPDTWKKGAGQKIDSDFVVKKALSYKSVFDKTGGGITFTGGDPLFQIEFLTEVVKKIKEVSDIHIAIDTSGYFVPSEPNNDFLKNIDLVLLDIKTAPDKYRALTTKGFEKTKRFIELLNTVNAKVWVRFVLIPNITSDKKIVKIVAKTASTIKNIQRVDVLSFHQFGKEKWNQLGFGTFYKLSNKKPPSEELVKQTKEIFNKYKLKTP